MEQLESIIQNLQRQPEMYYKTVGVDGLTEMQKLDMRAVMKQAKKDARDASKVDELVPSQREWGKSSERMRLIVRALRDLECNFLATAFISETRKENKSEGTSRVVKIHPSIPGKLKNELPGFFDIVGLLQAKTVEQGGEIEVIRTLQTVPTSLVIAKDRSNALPHLMEHPSVPLMWETIHSDSDSKVKGK